MAFGAGENDIRHAYLLRPGVNEASVYTVHHPSGAFFQLHEIYLLPRDFALQWLKPGGGGEAVEKLSFIRAVLVSRARRSGCPDRYYTMTSLLPHQS